MGTSYHQEALRKARIQERMQAANERLSQGGNIMSQEERQSTKQRLFSMEPGISNAEQSREPVHMDNPYREDHILRHRRVDNTSKDQIKQFMFPEYKEFKLPATDLPPRKTHVKV